jgi:serine/threonine-protein kinase
VSDDAEKFATGSRSCRREGPPSFRPEYPPSDDQSFRPEYPPSFKPEYPPSADQSFKPEYPPSDDHPPAVSAPPYREAEPQPSRHRTLWMLIGAAVVVLVAALGVTGYLVTRSSNPKSTPPAAVLDGTYRLDQDGAKITTNGAPAPTPALTGSAWFAFRSSCGSTGCAATGTRLDNNHQVALTPAQTTVMRFVDGHWQKVPARVQHAEDQCLGANGTIVPGEETKVVTVSWEPQPDGTLRGVKAETVVTNECGHQGVVWQYPMLATRVGDVPAGVTVADPATVTAAAATSSPAPAVAGPTLHGSYRLDFDRAHQTNNGVPVSHPVANESGWFAFRSLCTSSGCVATGARLSADDHQKPTGDYPRVLRFADGHWQDTPYLVWGPCSSRTGQVATSTATEIFSLEPQPDGTLRGHDTMTVLSNECGSQGHALQAPVVATWQGDVPPGVILADPGLF